MGNRSQRHVLHGTSEHQQRGKIEKAVGMSFGGRNTKVHTMGAPWATPWCRCSVTTTTMTPCIPFSFSVRQRSRETASSATKLTVHKLSREHVCHSLQQRDASRDLQITTFPGTALGQVPLSERIFTRYDKRDASFFAFVLIAAIIILSKEHRYLVFKQSLVSFDIFNFINIGFAHAKENQSRARRSTLRVTSEKNSFLLFMEKSPFSWWCFLA